MLKIPRQFSRWRTEDVDVVDPKKIQAIYEAGFAGVGIDEEERQKFSDWSRRINGAQYAGELATQYGFAGVAAGKLSMNWVWCADILGVCPWPGNAQERGDCVSHGTRNMGTLTALMEIVCGLADEVTGLIEAVPDSPMLGRADGWLATEAIYWWRDHGGDGWDCGHAANVLSNESGMWLRQDYPEFGVNLTEYSGKTAGKYGRSNPPQEYKTAGGLHLMRSTSEVEDWEAGADMLFNGSGLNSCGGQSWSSKRDENGFSPTSRGGWSHSECYLACDYRPWVMEKYGVPALFLQQNSWGPSWNGGPRDVHDSAQFVPASKKAYWIKLGLVNPATGNLMIPEGSRWVGSNTLKSRSLYTAAGASGWRRKKLPNYGLNF